MKIPIVFTFDENYAAAGSVAIQSLLATKNPETEYEIIVVHSGLSGEAKAKLEQWHPVRWIKFEPEKYGALIVSDRYNIACWYAAFLPEILTEYDKILYSDVDVLFKRDVSEAFYTDLGSKALAAVPVFYNNGPDKTELEKRMGDVVYTGDFLVMNLDCCRRAHSAAQMVQLASEYKDSLGAIQMELMNIVAKDAIVPLSFEYDVIAACYYNYILHGAIYATNYYSTEQMVEAIKNARKIHYTCDFDVCKIWNDNPENIPQDYMPYLLKSGFYKGAEQVYNPVDSEVDPWA